MNNEPKAVAGGIPVYCAHDEIVDIMKVIPNPKNPNTHGERQIEILSQVIKAQGWRKPITVSKRSGFVVAGHGRLQAALLLKVDAVPVDYQNYANEAEEYADLIADNRIAELSHVDEDMLSDILKDIHTDIDTILTGYESYEIDEFLKEIEETTFIDDFHEPTTTPSNETPYDSYESKKTQTGEIDLADFSEENYKHQCPKCKFMW